MTLAPRAFIPAALNPLTDPPRQELLGGYGQLPILVSIQPLALASGMDDVLVQLLDRINVQRVRQFE